MTKLCSTSVPRQAYYPSSVQKLAQNTSMLYVECSQMDTMAKDIVKANGYSNVITVLKGKVKEIDLPVPKVSIIISEWIGYFLLYENMLHIVSYAHDKWLVNDKIDVRPIFQDLVNRSISGRFVGNTNRLRILLGSNLLSSRISGSRTQPPRPRRRRILLLIVRTREQGDEASRDELPKKGEKRGGV
nr:probable protein arginine N-methyltransferase 1 [Tanacetum cinerariifolium]